ncbi:MAG: SixA phosphatase family protein [Leptonema sp. (in: bacteria)]
MKFYLIRHGIAEKSDTQSDLERDLTLEGEKKLKKYYKKISKSFKKPDVLLCSTAKRSIKTAEIIEEIWKAKTTIQHEKLNPSASIEDYLSVLNEHLTEESMISSFKMALVTHEPDLSNFANYLLNDSIEYEEIEKKIKIAFYPQSFDFKLKKGSLMIIEWNGKRGTLQFYATPAILKKL